MTSAAARPDHEGGQMTMMMKVVMMKTMMMKVVVMVLARWIDKGSVSTRHYLEITLQERRDHRKSSPRARKRDRK